MAAVESTTSPAWCDLTPELLGRIAACSPKPAERANFRSVCRSWNSAARHHCRPVPLMPWAVLPDGSFLTLSDGGRDWSSPVSYGAFVEPFRGPHTLTLPENTTCVGSTDSWLALRRGEPSSSGVGEDSFLLHNPFSGATVPLPDVGAVGAKAPPGTFDPLHKVVLMRSTTDDIVAFLTNSSSYPLVLSMPGKGAWAPEPFARPFMYIIDIAFLGDDKLYGITMAEDLFSFGVALDDDQIPVVTDCKRVIRRSLDLPPHHYLQWSDDDKDYQDDDDGDEHASISGEEDGSSEEDSSYEEESDEEEDDSSEYSSDSSGEDDKDKAKAKNVREDKVFPSFHLSFPDGEDCPICIIRYLVEANGKLIMVKRQRRGASKVIPRYTREVEVFEADMDAGAWVPVDRLGDGGLVLFISKRFSKCVSACSYERGMLDEDTIYFMDTGEVFDMRSGEISTAFWCLNYYKPTWVFPPDI